MAVWVGVGSLKSNPYAVLVRDVLLPYLAQAPPLNRGVGELRMTRAETRSRLNPSIHDREAYVNPARRPFSTNVWFATKSP